MYKDELGTRMKDFYEKIPQTKLMRRTPVAVRLDGKSFHSFTRGFKKPFDDILIRSMQETMKYLCENIQGCVLGYTQSDEITLILVDYKKLNSAAWFDYEMQKLCSVSASMATMKFNQVFAKHVEEYISETWNISFDYGEALQRAVDKGAMFDSRCFNIPKEEVTNLLLWRQLDAARNSVQMLGRAYFSHKQLHGKSSSQIQDMLMDRFGVNWNDLSTYKKRGSCCVKGSNGWSVDCDIPMFKGDDRKYVEDLIYCSEE